MGKDSGNGFEVPKYTPPSYDNYSLSGATAVKNGDNFTVNYSPEDQATMNTVNKLRADLLSSLGIGSGGTNDPYTKALMDESLRLSQPKLENSLIGRGLGGSSVYSNSLTDLLSKAGIQAILGGQQYKTNNYNMLNNYLSGQQNLGQNLMALQQAGYNTKANLYDKQYQQILAQAMEDYNQSQQPETWELGLSKMMSIADPGGSYMGFYQNPRQTQGASAQSMSGLGKAMQLYSAYRGMTGGMGSMGGETTAPTQDYTAQIQPYQNMSSLADLYNSSYNNPYGGIYNKNYSSLTGLGY